MGVLDPLRDGTGLAETRRRGGAVEVRLVLEPGQSLILRTFDHGRLDGAAYRPLTVSGDGHPLPGSWKLSFTDGGPALPPARRLTRLVSWPELGDAEAAFSGTARYTLAFTAPGDAGDGSG